MPPAKNKPKDPGRGMKPGLRKFIKTYANKKFLQSLVFDPHYLHVTCFLLFVFEIFLNAFIIRRVPYTEIDWRAYMQEVEGFLNGTLEYNQLKGDTGPLVYPAGFVYIYAGLYYLTSQGTNVRLAQYIFLLFYLAQLYLSFRIYVRTCKVPPYALVLSTLTSYRIHSIFVLRLFNDPIAVLLFYLSLHLFLSDKWRLGSSIYSLAVSVKMNILLYAPCLLIAYLTNLGYKETFVNLSICAFVQIALGAPFLYVNALEYVKGSFNLGRVFEHKWTVNYRFLERHVFENRSLHLGLLGLHVMLLVAFAPVIKRYLTSYAKLRYVTESLQQREHTKESELTKQEKAFLADYERKLQTSPATHEANRKLSDNFSKIAQLFVLPFFVTNLIGIACARSLHYQFYSWYFHSLLYLVHCTGFRKPVMFLLLAVIEYCWNCYPSTNVSSALLHVCHAVLIFGVYTTMKR